MLNRLQYIGIIFLSCSLFVLTLIYLFETKQGTINEKITSEKKIIEKKKLQSKINVNTASLSELEELPGIGKVLASRIIEERQKSKFKTPQDLLRVKGIGEKKLLKIKDYITF